MADTRKDVERREGKDDERDDGPRQSVRLMPDENNTIGPFFPSGMSAPEAAFAGATADLTEAEVEKIDKVRSAAEGEGRRERKTSRKSESEREDK